jgi:type VI secretion system protein ImpH
MRLRPDTSFAHPRSSVTDVEFVQMGNGPERFQITEAFIGLYGLRTPMPSIIGEELLQRDEIDDPVRTFLDVFHHRALSLLYRAWAHSRAEGLYDPKGGDTLTATLFALIGLPLPLLPAGAVPRGVLRLARYCRLFVRKSRPAEGLEMILSDLLDGVPVRLEPYAARWVPISSRQQNRLGRQCSTLGTDLHVGERVSDAATTFKLRVGPIDHSKYRALAPGGDQRPGFGALVHLYTSDALDYQVELGIEGAHKPECRLRGASNGVKLGIDTWLRAAAPQLSWTCFHGVAALADEGRASGVPS